jgi:hypothetical protein
VHLLLGNHEAMNLSGDLRYVSAGDYAQFGTEALPGLPEGFLERRAAFAPDGEYGRWLLGKPVAIVINDTLFVHAGLSPKPRRAVARGDQRDLAARPAPVRRGLARAAGRRPARGHGRFRRDPARAASWQRTQSTSASAASAPR